jgi:hypothetical protein
MWSSRSVLGRTQVLLPPVTLASGFQRRKDAAHHVGQAAARVAKRPGGINAVRPFEISLKILFL